MPSISYRRWTTVGASALDQIAHAHTAVGGTARGRRYTTQQLNHAYAVLLAAQFQRFCRDLHSECVDHLLVVVAPPPALLGLLKTELTRGRRLDRGNAQPSNLGEDFARFGFDLWRALSAYDPASAGWKSDLDLLHEWRNAIAHQDFSSPRLGATMHLRLARVRGWRASCRRLARAMDAVLHRHMQVLTGTPPW